MHHLPQVILKPGKDVPVRAGHPWIFSQAIAHVDDANALALGEIVAVVAHDGTSLGAGTWNPHTSIAVRLLTSEVQEPIGAHYFIKRFRALDHWKQANLPNNTSGYRVVHAEADGIPGLILDRYDRTYVFQIHTAGMERLRACLIEAIQTCFTPDAIIERSDISARKQEHLLDQPVHTHAGSVTAPVLFYEAGIPFYADVIKGQKTGFFLDQREARLLVGRYAQGKRVLNLFGYSGAFSIHAALGGAAFVATVDASHDALLMAEKNFTLNKLDPHDETKTLFLEADVLDLLHDEKIPGGPYDVIICDPPAFAKGADSVPQALHAYTEVNTLCLQQLAPGGILVSSSCSGRIEPEDFRSVLRIAAGRARRDVRLRDWITQPIDHAERLAFPEGRYLKTAILEVQSVLS